MRERAVKASSDYFEGKTVTVGGQPHTIDDREASHIMVYLEDNDYIDSDGNITPNIMLMSLPKPLLLTVPNFSQ